MSGEAEVGVETTTPARGVAMMTIRNGRRRNALSPDVLDALISGFADLAADPDVRAIVITGEGSVFSSGGDASRMGGRRPSPLEKKAYLERGVGGIAKLLARYDKPLVAALNGPAVGAGMDLALWCDFRIAAPTAFLKAGYIDVALPPGFGAAWHLNRLVGPARAMEILLTGRRVEAEEALTLGLYTSVVDEPDQLEAEAVKLGEVLASKPVDALRLTKRLIRQAGHMDVLDSLDMASSHFGLLQESPDHAEGVAAMKERREPDFW